MKYQQIERWFPGAEKLTPEEKRWLSSRENPDSPFHRLVGNSAAVEQCELIVYQALGRINHRASDLNVAWIGPAGVGKTTFARAIATALKLPYVEGDPQSLKNPNDVFEVMQRELSKMTDDWGRSLEMIRQYDGSYFAPSCVFFIDEVHQLGTVAQSLLRATAPNTHMLEGKDDLRLDTRAVMWQFATTDRGLLFDAFDTRFMKIELQPYNKDEVAKIVHIQNPDIPLTACRRLSEYYYLVTREALDAAKMVRMQKSMRGGSWEDAIDTVRVRDGIDEFGLSRKRLAVLRSLGNGRKSLSALATAAGCKPEEMERFILPPLVAYGDGVEPLVETGAGGRYITEAGLRELDRRGIPHAGKSALPRSRVA